MKPIDTTLTALAERLCTAAGIDLNSATLDLRGTRHDGRTPPALRAGWNLPDTAIPTPRTEDGSA